MNYYNENDPWCVHLLDELSTMGIIPAGYVDPRPIQEVTPNDLKGFTQCHFFAGGGFWPIAAQAAGWPEDRQLWTGSCPCQPFSVAGKQEGNDDPRHLWPYFSRLISEVRPAHIMGEQVGSKAGYTWFDGVCDDLEKENYTCGAADIAACAVDAPHKRARLYWHGHLAYHHGRDPSQGKQAVESGNRAQGALVYPVGEGSQRYGWNGDSEEGWQESFRSPFDASDSAGQSYWGSQWIECYDGKARRTKPDIRFLVNGVLGRVDHWRTAGNAIVPILAEQVIRSYIETYIET